MKRLLIEVSTWRAVTLVLFAAILIIAFFQPTATAPDIRAEAPRIAAAAALFLIAVAVVPMLLKPVAIAQSRWIPWITAVLSGSLIALPSLLNAWGRQGAAGSIFRALHVVTGEHNFGDIELPLVWRLCASQGADVYSDLTCVQANIAANPQHFMDYGPGWLWFPWIAIPPSWSILLGLAMLIVTSASLWWLSRNSLGRGQIALLVGSLGASWLLLLERANIDAIIIWFAVAFAIALQRSHGLAPWIFAAGVIWILGSWKYYPFALGLLLLPVIRKPKGWLVLAGFVAATSVYVLLVFDRFTQAQLDNADRSALIGSGLGRDSISRLVSGMEQAPSWALALVLLAALSAATWGFVTAGASRAMPFSNSMLALVGALMVAVPMIASGFGHQYKAALLVLAVPALSRLRPRSTPAVWQSSTFALIASAVALVGIWGNPFTWSILVVVATAFSLGVGIQGLIAALRVTRAADESSPERV